MPMRAFVLAVLVTLLASARPAAAQSLIVAHNTGRPGESAISVLDMNGNVLRQFGEINPNGYQAEFRAHLADSGGVLSRSNGVFSGTISMFDTSGTLLRDVVVNSSAQHTVNAIAADFTNQSIFFVDVFAGTSCIRHLDDPATGASTVLGCVSYNGNAGVIDLYFGGPAGSEALYALNHTSPYSTNGIERVARIDSHFNVTFLDNSEFDTP